MTVPTDAEAVEQLAVDYDARVTCQPDRVCKVQRADCCFCVLTAATLRALLAERDAAQRLVNEARGERDEAIATLTLYRAENGCTRGQRTTQWCAEASAARAEVARLRRLWTYMQEAAADPDADEPMTAAEWLAEFDDAESRTRAALAQEPGHE